MSARDPRIDQVGAAAERFGQLLADADSEVAVGGAIRAIAERFQPDHAQSWEALRWAIEERVRPRLGANTKTVVWSILGPYMGRTAGRPLALVDGESALPSPEELAREQTTEARTLLYRDVSTFPRWTWPDLYRLTGPMLPGELIVVGAGTGGGKSALLMSQMDAFARAGMPTLYVPLEVDPAACRIRWAAWRLGLDVIRALRQEWHLMPEGSKESIMAMVEGLETAPVHFADERRITVPELRAACERTGCRVVMIDHLHRMNFGTNAAAFRVAVTEAARELRDMARELAVVVITAVQLNRTSDPLDAFTPPQLARIKESAGIAEEAHVVLMLSRRLKGKLPENWNQKLRTGALQEWQLAEPGTMVVTCRKHREDGDALNRRVLLSVVNGRVEPRARRGDGWP